jgi:hypothetical protein
MKIAFNHFVLLDGKGFFWLIKEAGKEGVLWKET